MSFLDSIKLMEENATSSRNVWNQLDKKTKTEQSRIHQLQVEAEKSKARLQKRGIADKNDHDTKRKKKRFLKTDIILLPHKN